MYRTLFNSFDVYCMHKCIGLGLPIYCRPSERGGRAELQFYMCQRGSLTSWVSWCTAVFTVRHFGTSPTISSQPLTSLLGFVCVLQTDTSSSYLAVDSTHTAVGRFRSMVRRSGTRCLTSSEIRRVVLTVLNSFLRQSSLVSTNVTCQRIRSS